MERIYRLTHEYDEVEKTDEQLGFAIIREEEGADGKTEYLAYLFDMDGHEVGHGHAYATEANALRYTKRRAGANAFKFVSQAEDYNGAKVVAGALLDSDDGKFIVTISSCDENYVDSPTTTITELFPTYDEAWDFYQSVDLRRYGKLESKKSLWRRTYEPEWGKRQVMISCCEYRHWAVEG